MAIRSEEQTATIPFAPEDWRDRLRLDPDNITPLYYQLKQRLRAAAIVLEPGTLLPSERELMGYAGVGRATARKAVADLVQEGILDSRQGRGTYTSPRRLEAALERLEGFTETMTRLGRRPTTRVRSLYEVPAAPEIAAQLRISAGASVFVIDRLRLIDGDPAMIERTHLNGSLVPGLLDKDLTGSLYSLLEREYGLRPSRGSEGIVAMTADRALATALGVPVGAALLATARTTEASDGRVIEHTIRHARGDLFSFRVGLFAGSFLHARAEAEPLFVEVRSTDD